MKIRSITFTQRFNMGNYEHIEITAMADIEEQEAADTAMQSLKTFVQTALNKKVEEIKAPVEEVKPEPVVEAPKKEKKAKKEKAVETTIETVIKPSELPPVEPDGFISKPVGKNVVIYNSNLAEHKSIFGGYLTKKYENSWKTSHPADEIKSFTASLNGKHFLDNDGKIVESFLNLVHEFFGA